MNKRMQITPAALGALAGGDLENFMVAATPGGIEAQEKSGQIEQSFRQTLPVKGTSTEEERNAWESLGFKFKLDRVAAQNQGRGEIFVECEFPKDWRKKVTDHDMWTKLVDDKGRERASIFYKAAFYDRSAHVRFDRRFTLSSYEHVVDKTNFSVVVKDYGKTVKDFGTWKSGSYKDCDALEKLAREWLNANWPEWEKTSAYWD